jgi:hypothetical protein
MGSCMQSIPCARRHWKEHGDHVCVSEGWVLRPGGLSQGGEPLTALHLLRSKEEIGCVCQSSTGSVGVHKDRERQVEERGQARHSKPW